MEFQAGAGCPAAKPATAQPAYRRPGGLARRRRHRASLAVDFVFYLGAGQDESSTWQEFGDEVPTKEDVTDEFGPPDPALPNWNNTRYVEWTSCRHRLDDLAERRRRLDPREASGMSVYAHELSHILGIGDNYNNPYSVPACRAYSGPGRCSSIHGLRRPAQPLDDPADCGRLDGRAAHAANKIDLGMVDEQNVLRLSREALDESGLVVANVTARVAQPGTEGSVRDQDERHRRPGAAVQQSTDPFCDGRGYNNYTVEVVDRMGTDSFTPTPACCWPRPRTRTGRRSSGWSTPTRRTSG